MTNTTTNHPYGIPHIELSDSGRRISFEKDCLAELIIKRKVNDGDWNILIKDARSPYTDSDGFPKGTRLTYTIELQYKEQQKQYKLQATV